MSKETKCNLINCLTGHTCGRNIENAEEPKLPEEAVIKEINLPNGDKVKLLDGYKGKFQIEFNSPQKEEPNWLDRFYDLYIEGRKNKAPSCFIDYFKARSFLSQEISKAHQETIAKVREMIEGMKKEVPVYNNPAIPPANIVKEITTIVDYNQGLQDLSDKLKGI